MTRPLSDLCDLSPGQKGHTEVCILLDFFVNRPSASMSRSELQEVEPQGQIRAGRDSRWGQRVRSELGEIAGGGATGTRRK